MDDRLCPACGADIIGNDPHGPGCPRDRDPEDDGLRIVWLPVNQACVVMFGESILKGPCPRAEAEEYVRDLRASVAAHPAGKARE